MIREGNTKAFGHICDIYPMYAPPKDLIDKFITNDVIWGQLFKEPLTKLLDYVIFTYLIYVKLLSIQYDKTKIL